MTGEHDTPVLACTIDAIPKEQRPLHQANAERLFASVQEIRELAIGTDRNTQEPNEGLFSVSVSGSLSVPQLNKFCQGVVP
ncbi:MAG: hypothetical protein H0U76_16360 [Ktedonobacteraceae bacterium]|nr:hypothetical protein [Ktedonobacteraceae bacterium]